MERRTCERRGWREKGQGTKSKSYFNGSINPHKCQIVSVCIMYNITHTNIYVDFEICTDVVLIQIYFKNILNS